MTVFAAWLGKRSRWINISTRQDIPRAGTAFPDFADAPFENAVVQIGCGKFVAKLFVCVFVLKTFTRCVAEFREFFQRLVIEIWNRGGFILLTVGEGANNSVIVASPDFEPIMAVEKISARAAGGARIETKRRGVRLIWKIHLISTGRVMP
jgi:hypothetical protein